MIVGDERAVYHVISRTALGGLTFGDVEKDEFVRVLQRFSMVYITEVQGCDYGEWVDTASYFKKVFCSELCVNLH
jgi:hypothetical protein